MSRSKRSCAAKASATNSHPVVTPPPLNPGRYDIFLRPSLELAEETIGLTSVWLGEDIVIEDVELTLEGISEPASPSPGSAR